MSGMGTNTTPIARKLQRCMKMFETLVPRTSGPTRPWHREFNLVAVGDKHFPRNALSSE